MTPPPATLRAVCGATVIDGTDRPARPRTTILVEGDRILHVGRDAEVPVPPQAERIDASGRWVVPGLMDLHVHYRPWMAPLCLAHGVTTVRDVGNSPEHVVRWQAESADPERAVPLLRSYGPLLDCEPPHWPPAISWGIDSATAARDAVARLARMGFGGIKVHLGLDGSLLAVVVDEAHRRGLPITVHTGIGSKAIGPVRVDDALGMRVDGLEHLVIAITDLPSRDPLPAPATFAGLEYGDRILTILRAWASADLAAPASRRLVERVAEAGVTWAFTLALSERWSRLDQRDVMEAPGYRLVDGEQRAEWESRLLPSRWDETEAAVALRGQARMLAFAGMLRQAGARILAGTDARNPFVVPGASLLRELELLVEAGLSPHEALVAATRRGAEVLGEADRLGTLEPGKIANLVLLDGDPMADVRNLRRIDRVMCKGRLHEPAALLAGP